MKVVQLLAVITLGAGLVAGCSKQESQPAASSTPPPAAKEPKPAAEAPQAPAEVQQPVEAVKPAAEAVASSATESAGSMIDKAKALVAESKYSEAMDLLKKLSAMKLTPEQQQLVNDLTAQVQQAMPGAAATEATQKAKNAVGGMLGGNQ